LFLSRDSPALHADPMLPGWLRCSWPFTTGSLVLLAVSASWPARRSKAISVYLLALVGDRPKSNARCSGSAGTARASWRTRSRRMRSMLAPRRCRFQLR
jgi:hypothetical protein